MRVRVSTLRRFVRKALREHSGGQQGRDFDHSPGYSSDADMARTQLKNIAARASKLHSSLKDDDDLPAWVLSKMAVADSYMTSLSDYLHGEMDRTQEDPEYSSEYEYSEEDDSSGEMDSDDIEGALSSMLSGMDYDDEESDDEDHHDRVASFETGYDFAVDDMDDDDDDDDDEEDMEGYGDPEMPEEDEDEDEDMEDYGDPEMPEDDDETGEDMPPLSN